jgi:hypothetical protein
MRNGGSVLLFTSPLTPFKGGNSSGKPLRPHPDPLLRGEGAKIEAERPKEILKQVQHDDLIMLGNAERYRK